MTIIDLKIGAVLLVCTALAGCPTSGFGPEVGPILDAAPFDTGPPDAEPDGSINDGNMPDGLVDAGGTDGSLDDAHVDDGGQDSGPLDPCDGPCPPGETCDTVSASCVEVPEPQPGDPGGSCADDRECGPDGSCVAAAPGGFCSRACDAQMLCAIGLTCVESGSDARGNPRSTCLDECDVTGCRDGWVCADVYEGDVCIPSCESTGCSRGERCDEMSGLCETFERPVGLLGDACATDTDHCGEGLTCLPENENGTGACAALCDVDGFVAPCEHGLCLAFEGDNPEGIGVCILGDRCAPNDPQPVCGDGSACVAVAPVSFCVPTGDGEPGAECGEDTWCGPDLICQYGQCQRPCVEGLCDEGADCLDLSAQIDGGAFSFCHEGCEPGDDRACGRAACALVDVQANGDFVGACADGPAGQGNIGDACRPNDTYWGTCDADLFCDTDAERPICRAFCTGNGAGQCARSEICAEGLFVGAFEHLGLCMHDCNVLGPTPGCSQGQVCRFAGIFGTDSTDAHRPIGECLAATPRTRTGGRCVNDRSVNDCVNGNICAVTEDGAPAHCVRLCDTESLTAVGGPWCDDETACETAVFGSPRFGVCLQ